MKYTIFIMGAVIFSGLTVSSVQAEEMMRADMSARIEQKQLQAEITKERMKAIQEIQQQRINNAEEIQARMMQVAGFRKEKNDTLEDIRLQTKERIEKEKTIMMERRAEMATKLHSRMVFGFESAIQKMAGFLDRASERITIMQSADMNVSDAESLVADMRTQLAEIEVSVKALSTVAVSIEDSGSTPSELNQELRKDHAIFMDSAKEIRLELGSLRESFTKLLPMLKADKE
jgi:hypothetical protein